MKLLRNIPIRRKLTIITMLTSCVALLVACFLFAAYERVNLRREMVRDLEVTAEMTGANSAAGLAFHDPSSVEDTLRAFRARPAIMRACVYDADGLPFAVYQRQDLEGSFTPPKSRPDGNHFREDALEVFKRIDLAGETVGTVFIQSDLGQIEEAGYRYAAVVVVLLGGCSLIAFLVGSRLQRIISKPIASLAQTAGQVARDRDYGVRAVKESDDELGSLIDAFNEMLSQIQQRDSALLAARNELEKRVAERTEELATSNSLLNSTLDSTADGIVAARFTGEIACYNSQFAGMWDIPPEVLSRRSGKELVEYLAPQVRDSEEYAARIFSMQAERVTEAFEVIELRDGRTFERFVKPLRIGSEVAGAVVNLRDVTARKRSEAELEKIHEQLMETSRLAGMAEVATGVLHNVGNVLNSINVSAALLAENVRQSRVTSLGRIVALLEEHAENLGEFIGNSPQGQQLPVFLRQLHERLLHEQKTQLTEIQSLHQNIDHINDIVAMQQSYAKVSGIMEQLDLTDLVEDSLRMNAAALARHDVRVTREFSPVPQVIIEKHKALQILVNLIRNAKGACDEAGVADKRLTIRLGKAGNMVRISVSDNGVGIPAENLTRIFSHGFTTRKDGHGFGLHSGALSAREMGGSLRAESPGRGHGATFTLEIPYQQPATAPAPCPTS